MKKLTPLQKCRKALEDIKKLYLDKCSMTWKIAQELDAIKSVLGIHSCYNPEPVLNAITRLMEQDARSSKTLDKLHIQNSQYRSQIFMLWGLLETAIVGNRPKKDDVLLFSPILADPDL